MAYGAGDLGPAITANIAVFFLLVFFTNVAGIPAGLAGSILMIGKIWDGINDPIVGMLTDKTQSRRWGRRLTLDVIWGNSLWNFLFLAVDCTAIYVLIKSSNIWSFVLVLRSNWDCISGILHCCEFALYGNDSRTNSGL